MSNKVIEESLRTPVLDEVDVVVVGGGPAGVSAAVGAAKAGASVFLVERHGFLGGMWTAGLVTTLAGYNTWLRPYTRVVNGIAGEWLRRATAMSLAEDNNSWVLNSDAEGMKLVADEMVRENNIKALYHTWCADAIVENSAVTGVIIENVDGRAAIRAKCVVDCTGNGDVIARSGAGWSISDTLQPMTMPFRLGNLQLPVDKNHLDIRHIPIGPEPVEMQGKLLAEWASPRSDVVIDYAKMREARTRGEIPAFGGPWLGGLYKDIVWVNATRVIGNAADARELTDAEITGRRNCFELLQYFRESVPGMESARILHTSTQIGVRETRRLDGVYTLTGDDVKQATDFDDGIGLGCWSIDIHPVESSSIHTLYVPRPFKIPYRSLVPASMDGLLAAGRCASCDREALGTIRVGAQCCVMGHAAGVAAAISAAHSIAPRDVSVRELQSELLEQNAILDVEWPA